MYNLIILAQADGDEVADQIFDEEVSSEEQMTSKDTDGNNLGEDGKTPSPSLLQYWPFLLLIVLMYVMLFRSPRKKQQEHRQMIAAIEKNDKVRTIGGIIGTVVEVKENEVVLKIDESNNTKMRIVASAIGKNLSKESK